MHPSPLAAGRGWLLRVFALVAALLLALPLVPVSVAAAEPCNCVTYLKTGLGLIPSGVWSAADYGPTLQNIGYKKIERPKRDSLVVFARGVLGSDPAHGHIGLVRAASFDQESESWTIDVQHARWTVGQILEGAGPCQGGGSVRLTSFTVRSLDGLGFYRLPRALRLGAS